MRATARLNLSLSDIVLSALIILATEAYTWLLAPKALWFLIIPIALVFLLWRRQSQTAFSLGLSLSSFVQSFRRWNLLWLLVTAMFLFLGRHILWDQHVLLRGCLYFFWCCLQQLLYQSVICRVIRQRVANPWAAAPLCGLIFAALHLPNPVLVPATLVWGVAASLLFEKVNSILALALLQVMLSSMLMWLTPYHWHHGFRTGRSYYSAPFR